MDSMLLDEILAMVGLTQVKVEEIVKLKDNTTS